MPNCKHFETCELTDEADPEAGFCILHSQKHDKDSSAFATAFDAHLSVRGYELAAVVFPAETDFSDRTIDGHADFSNAVFMRGADFRRTNFTLSANFSGATFYRETLFYHANFQSVADFTKTKFWRNVKFTDSSFHNLTFFSDSEFLAYGVFDDVTFHHDAIFVGSKFRLAVFSGARFEGLARFENVTFEEAFFKHAVFATVLFDSTRFRNNTDFNAAIFNGYAVFQEVQFERSASFIEVDFKDNVRFSKVRFACAETPEGAASFCRTVFRKNSQFVRVIFFGLSDFSHVTFEQAARFQAVSFRRRVTFSWAQFDAEAYFVRTSFYELGNFAGSIFNKAVDFSRTAWRSFANFSHTVFYGDVLFIGERDELIFAGCKITFRPTLHVSSRVLFQYADLRQCRFHDTDCRYVEFRHSTWPRRGDHLIAFDEIAEPLVERARAELEHLYRTIKQSYERQGDYERAGDFHFGEKRMLQSNPDTVWPSKIVLSLYGTLSGYGEQYLKPLAWFCFLVFGGTFFYLCPICSGLTLGPDGPEVALIVRVPMPERDTISGRLPTSVPPALDAPGSSISSSGTPGERSAVDGSLTQSNTVAPPGPTKRFQTSLSADNFVKALRLSIAASLLLTTDEFVLDRELGRYFKILQSILGPLLLGLFALAVRQRVRR